MNLLIKLTGGLFFTFISIYIVIACFVRKDALQDNKVKSDIIMVLGARAYIDNAYNPCLYARVQHAVELYKAHYAPKMLVTGGTDIEDNINEAETMRQIAIDLGVPSEDILLETASTSTYENFLFSKKILDAASFKTVILVTEPFHALRASLVAKKQGFTITTSPAIDSVCWKKNTYFSKFILKEPLAIMFYQLRNRV